MLTRRTTLLSLTALAAAPQALAQTGPHGSRAEVEALKRFTEATHPRGAQLAGEAAWNAYWSAFAARADGLNFATYAMGLKACIAQLRDGHSTIPIGGISQGAFGLRLPIGARPFYDGLYVTSAKDEGARLLGARIISIGGQPINGLCARFAADWPANNPAWSHHDLGLLLVPGVLHGMEILSGADDAPVRVEAVTRTGRTVRATLAPTATGRDRRTSLARARMRHETLAATAGAAANYVTYLDSERAIYVSFNTLDIEIADARALTNSIFSALENTAAQRVVIDLRRNGGGNNFNAEAIRRGLQRSRFNRPGGLYVLIAPQTFSAAQNLANRLERETFAIFVGEPTGGAPNHYGDAMGFVGADSGLNCYVSTLPWFDSVPMDQRRWIFPDHLAPETFANFVAGRDPALDFALTSNDDAAPEEFTRERVFYYERESQAGEWTPFWMI